MAIRNMPVIHIGRPDGTVEHLRIRRNLVGLVADALCDAHRQVWSVTVTMPSVGIPPVYHLESRADILSAGIPCNPLWILQNPAPGAPTGHTRHSV